MKHKVTSSKVSKLASKLLNDATPNADVRAAIADAVTGCGIPLNERAANAVVDRIIEALEPFLTTCARSPRRVCRKTKRNRGRRARRRYRDITTNGDASDRSRRRASTCSTALDA
jgi:hypothetical protein